MKFRIRDDEKNEFEVWNVREIEARTRSFIAKATTVAGLGILVLAAGYFAISGDSGGLAAIINCTLPVLGFVLGHYFKNRDG